MQNAFGILSFPYCFIAALSMKPDLHKCASVCLCMGPELRKPPRTSIIRLKGFLLGLGSTSISPCTGVMLVLTLRSEQQAMAQARASQDGRTMADTLPEQIAADFEGKYGDRRQEIVIIE